ncbi:hypothetical protein PSE10B_08790 [Pseudomonas amygdali pv. eriobotryae]|nr:hypothetical protein PSE10B_08790 [Pseudomonas amygdali pv. eriobotryae]
MECRADSAGARKANAVAHVTSNKSAASAGHLSSTRRRDTAGMGRALRVLRKHSLLCPTSNSTGKQIR